MSVSRRETHREIASLMRRVAELEQRSGASPAARIAVPPGTDPDAGVVAVYNDSDETVPRFGVLGLGDPLVDPDDDLAAFQRRVAFIGDIPTPAHLGRLCVVQRELGPGQAGPGVVSGATPARITGLAAPNQDYGYADLAPDDATALAAAPHGTARILWAQADADPAWAYVRLGNRAPVIEAFRVRERHDDHLVARTWDGATEGGDDVLIAKPYLLRRTPFDGKTRWHVAHDYVSDHERQSTDLDSNVTETQVIVPRYVLDADGGEAGADVIVATASVGGLPVVNGRRLTWLALGDGRAWAKKTVNP